MIIVCASCGAKNRVPEENLPLNRVVDNVISHYSRLSQLS